MAEEDGGPAQPDDGNAREGQLELFPESILHQMIAVERERIDSANKRKEVARLAIETNDAADQRQ